MASPRILYCRCAYAKVVPQDVKDGVLEQLADSDAAFDSVADLCQMSAAKDPSLKQLAEQPGLKIAACYPRAVKWLFAAANSPLGADAEIVNMRTLPVVEACQQLLGDGRTSHDKSVDSQPEAQEE